MILSEQPKLGSLLELTLGTITWCLFNDNYEETFLFQNTHRARSNTFHHLELCCPQEYSKPFSSETNLDNKGNSVARVHYSSNVSLAVLPFPDVYNSQSSRTQSDEEMRRVAPLDRINWMVVKEPKAWMICVTLMFYAGTVILVYQSMPAFAEESGDEPVYQC